MVQSQNLPWYAQMKERGIVQKLQELGDKEKEGRRQKDKEGKEDL